VSWRGYGGSMTNSGDRRVARDGGFGRSLSVQGRQMREVPPGDGVIPPARIWRGGRLKCAVG
jgi:hypothetical protein